MNIDPAVPKTKNLINGADGNVSRAIAYIIVRMMNEKIRIIVLLVLVMSVAPIKVYYEEGYDNQQCSYKSAHIWKST